MHIPRWFLWLLLYLGGFLAWVVYFEYGPRDWKNGTITELNRAWDGAVHLVETLFKRQS